MRATSRRARGPRGIRELGSEIYRAVAVTGLDWLLEAGPVLLVDVDEGVLLHSFGPKSATRRNGRGVTRYEKEAGAGES